MPMELHFDFCIASRFKRSLRVDQYISDMAEIVSRNQLKQRLVEIRVNENPAKLSRKVSAGDRIEITLALPPSPSLEPEEIDLDIVYEDRNVIVINKPQGMVVHPAPGNYTGTLVHGLLHYRDIEAEENDFRPGIVHRLDKDTSGILITAKNEVAHKFLSDQFAEKTTRKTYFALCRGWVAADFGHIEGQFGRSPRNRQRFTVLEQGGKYASTRYKVICRWKDTSFVALYPETGRTHQLRVHMRHIGHPILGDVLYGAGEKDGCSLMLHAFELRIQLPGNSEKSTFRAFLDRRFARLIRDLKKDSVKDI